MEPLREFDTAINRAGVSSATAANQGVHDQAGGGGGGSGSGEEGVTQDPGLVSLRGVNFRWSCGWVVLAPR